MKDLYSAIFHLDAALENKVYRLAKFLGSRKRLLTWAHP